MASQGAVIRILDHDGLTALIKSEYAALGEVAKSIGIDRKTR
jgi:hypothetical protein